MRTVAAEYCSFKSKDICWPLYSEGYGLVSQVSLLGYTYYSSVSFSTHIETLSPPSVLTRKKGFKTINSDTRLNKGLSYLQTPRAVHGITEEELFPVKQEILNHFTNIGKRIVIYLNEKQI